MALSGSTDFSMTAGELIASVLKLFGIGLNGESATAQETNDALEDLNLLVKSLTTKGLKLWLRKNEIITLTAAKKNYTLGAAGDVVMDRPLEIVSAFRRDTAGNDTIMTIFSRDEYRMLSTEASEGPPINIYFDPQLTTSEINIWPVPTTADAAEFTIHLDYRKPVDDLDTTTDDLEFPAEWLKPLKWNLAKEAMMSYDLPESRQRRIEKFARDSLKDAEGFDTENNTSMFFQPNTRGY
jgi:hypothetical protein